jgi:hypothetical protein
MDAVLRANIDRLRTRMCGQKTAWSNRKRALQARNRINRAFDVYKCTFCSSWHLGHPPTVQALVRHTSLLTKDNLDQYWEYAGRNEGPVIRSLSGKGYPIADPPRAAAE